MGIALWGPGTSVQGQGSSAAFTGVHNHAGDEFYTVFTAPKAGSLDQIVLHVTAVSGGGRTLAVGISTLDANNHPTGTPAGGSAYESLAIAATGLKSITLTTPATVVAGTGYAVHVKDGGGAAGSVTFRTSFQMDSENERFGQVIGKFDNAATRSIITGLPAFAARYSDGEYLITAFTDAIGLSSFASTSTPDEIGNLFTVPVDMTISGMGMIVGQSSAGGSATMKLYDNADVLLGSETFLREQMTSTKYVVCYFAAPVSLTAGVNYRMTWLPVAGTSSIWRLQFDDSAHRTATGLVEGTRWQRTQRTNAGAWTQNALELIEAFLIVDTLDIVVAPSCSGLVVSYGAWTRTGPNNTPVSVSFSVADGDNAATGYEIWTGAGRTGTQVAAGSCTAGTPVSISIAYNAAGLVDGNQTLYLSVNDGSGNVGDDCSVTFKRDDMSPTAATGITAVPA